MGSIFTTEPLNRIVRGILGGGLSQLRKRALGRGIWGLAVPAAFFVIEDISRPNGVILPFFRWTLNKTAKVRIIEVSTRTFPEDSGDAPGTDR
jgi:hypothetical protein